MIRLAIPHLGSMNHMACFSLMGLAVMEARLVICATPRAGLLLCMCVHTAAPLLARQQQSQMWAIITNNLPLFTVGAIAECQLILQCSVLTRTSLFVLMLLTTTLQVMQAVALRLQQAR
jgi:hypothetical protein